MLSWKKVLLTAGVILFLVMVFVSGCQEAEETENNEVVIGFSGPLSGPAAEYGEDNLAGVEMAISDINNAGGITVDGQDYSFRLEYMDDQADPTQAVSNAERLRDVENAIAIWNPIATGINPTLEINEEEGHEFLMMAYTSTPEELEQEENELVMWIPPSFTSRVQAQGDVAWEEGWRDVAMLVTAGAYGDVWRESFQVYWEDHLGGNIVADHPTDYYEQTDYSTEITAIMAQDPDAILIGGPNPPTALAIEQAREMGYEGGFILIDQAKINYLEEVLGGLDDLENTIALEPLEARYTPSYDELEEKFIEEHDPTAVTGEHVQNYMAMIVLAEAMVEANSVDDPYAIREAIPEVFPILDRDVEYPLSVEYFGIADSGRTKGVYSINMIKDGKYSDQSIWVWFAESEEEYQQVMEELTFKEGKTYEDYDINWHEETDIYFPLVE